MTRTMCGTWVADQSVNSSPTQDAMTRARLHRARDQPLLPVVALEHDGRVAERRVQVADGHRELVALVARLVDQGRVLIQRGADVQHRRQRLVVHVDRGHRVGGGVAVAGDHAGDDLADVADLVHRHRRVIRDHDVGGDRPGARHAALLVGQVGAGEGGDDAGHAPARRSTSTHVILRVRVRAAHERHVQRAGQGDVVGPVGLAGDQLGVFLAQARPAELGGPRRDRLGHGRTPACAARRTARTMFS